MPKGQYTRTVRPVLCVIGPSIAYVPLTRGLFALIDSDDIPTVSKCNWWAAPNGVRGGFYAARWVKGGGLQLMHADIFGDRSDHCDPERSLDNRRANLRKASDFVRPVIHVIGPSIAYVPLTRNQVALIDSADIHLVSTYNWWATPASTRGGFYAARWVKGGGLKFMHTEILGVARGDHRDPERSLDNRRANLRLATHSENCANRRRRYDNKSGFKGVHFDKQSGMYRASIRKDGVLKNLGRRKTPEAAAELYRQAAEETFGEFARLA